MLADNRLTQAPILYGVFHTIAAGIWSVAFPLQHTAWIRRQHPRFHRITGYIGATCSLSIGVSSLLFLPYNLAYTHKKLTHIHRLPLPFIHHSVKLYFPTISLGVLMAAPMFLYTLVQMVLSARRKDFVAHRYWAVRHTLIGCFPAVQRVFMLVQFAVAGSILYAFGGPEKIKTLSDDERVWMGYAIPAPDSKEAFGAEQAAFALTSWGAAFFIFVYCSYEPVKRFVGGTLRNQKGKVA